MQDHNEYLMQVEANLNDLPIMAKTKIIEEINSDIIDKDVSELINPLECANLKRIEHGFVKYQREKKFSFTGFILKFFAISTLVFIIGISVLVWKFTPLLKIDEENNKIVILGGLIDIDGKAGKIKILDEVGFDQNHYTNDFQANIELDIEKDEIISNFKAGTFTLENSKTSELKIECKLSSQLTKDVIIQESDLIKVNLEEFEGANCVFKIPVDKIDTLMGNEAIINIDRPEFNAYIEINNGKVSIDPEQELDYKYNLNVNEGYIGEFESVETEEAYEILVTIENGSILSK
jgi:hypothetical protein